MSCLFSISNILPATQFCNISGIICPARYRFIVTSISRQLVTEENRLANTRLYCINSRSKNSTTRDLFEISLSFGHAPSFECGTNCNSAIPVDPNRWRLCDSCRPTVTVGALASQLFRHVMARDSIPMQLTDVGVRHLWREANDRRTSVKYVYAAGRQEHPNADLTSGRVIYRSLVIYFLCYVAWACKVLLPVWKIANDVFAVGQFDW